MSTFYNKFKEEERKEQEKLKEQELLKQQLLQQQLNNQTFNNQPIIIQNKSTFKSLIRFLISAFLFCMKSLFYISITVFSSIGVTVLLNESLRNTFIDFIKAVM